MPSIGEALTSDHWPRLANVINARCPGSAPVLSQDCETVVKRLSLSFPEAGSVLAEPAHGPRVWNHLLYSIAQERFGAPIFLNLGYGDTDGRFDRLVLDEADEPFRLFIQLYERAIGGVELCEREVAEVGCGAGGGAHYLARYHGPRSLRAFDLVERNIATGRSLPAVPGLSFAHGEAEALPLPDASVDVLINIESSFTYDFARFLGEVRRVLRPGGWFAITDHRPVDDEWGPERSLSAFRASLTASGMRVLRDDDITENVVAANLALAAPKELMLEADQLNEQDRAHFREILHCAGSRNHARLLARRWEYRSLLLQRA
jgi:SAM-dependent methyltransferase